MSAFEFVGEALVLMRRIKGLSQSEVARRAKMRSSQLSRYEKGETLPKLNQLDRLLQAHGATLLDFATILAAIRTPQRVLAAEASADEIRDSAGTTLLLREGGMLVPKDSYRVVGELVSRLNELVGSVQDVVLGRALREALDDRKDEG